MKKVGFIGAFDKTNLLLYTAKIFVELGHKVLIADTTILEKTRYKVPTIQPSKCYVTQYEGIDVAIGFDNFEDIKEYLCVSDLQYDYVFIDTDVNEIIVKMGLDKADSNYFVTAFDNYSLKKGLEVVGKSEVKIPMSKILFARNLSQEDNNYLDFLSFYSAIKWTKKEIYFPLETGDETVITENERSARMSYKELSIEYKEGLYSLAADIAPDLKKGEVKRILKNV